MCSGSNDMKSRHNALHGEKMKILLVDDDDALLSFLAKKLEEGGFEGF
jgi:hypothetical protein